MYLAFLGGIVVPILESIRRWHQIPDLHYFFAWFDDYIIGIFLLVGAWKTYKSPIKGQKWLIAAWAYAVGIAFSSFISQLKFIDQPDPAPVSSATVAAIKGIMFALSLLALILCLKENR